MSRTLPRLYFTEDEVAEILRPILASKFEPFGFRDVEVKEETDWDGEPSLMVRATTESRVGAESMIAAIDAANVALLKGGDRRFVYLRTKVVADGAGSTAE